MPSAILMTGPKHVIQDNRIAGGDYSGIWYYLGDKIDGNPECGWGIPIGIYSGNTIHSYEIYGVYIERLSSRSQSCTSLYTDYR